MIEDREAVTSGQAPTITDPHLAMLMEDWRSSSDHLGAKHRAEMRVREYLGAPDA